jgi:predicted amino acid-binding ACT domain protein
LFHKGSDSGVRTYIHNLRDKLSEYYKSEGKDEEFVFSIPKGQYSIKIEPRKSAFIGFHGKKVHLADNHFILILIATILLLSGVLFFIFTKNSAGKVLNSAIWKDVLKSKSPTLLVIGDHFFYGTDRVTSGGKGVIRDFSINSEIEFENFLSNNEELRDSIYSINWSYITKQGVDVLFRLLPYINDPENFRLILSSQLSFEEMKHNNIIYFGKYSTIGIIKDLVAEKYYSIDGDGLLSYYQKDTVITEMLAIANFVKEDYPMVLSLKTPYNKKVLMIIGMDDPGIIATLDYMLDLENVKMLEKNLHLTHNDHFFTALFEVKGYDRTDFSIRYILGEKLEED